MPREVSLEIVDKLGLSWQPEDAGSPEHIQLNVIVRDQGGEIRQSKAATFWRSAPPSGDAPPITETQEGHFIMGPAMEQALDALLASADRRLKHFVAPKDKPPAIHKLDKPEPVADKLSPQARAAATRKAAREKAQQEQAAETTEEAS